VPAMPAPSAPPGDTVCVVADDLTGAADAGVAFAGGGTPVRLLLTVRPGAETGNRDGPAGAASAAGATGGVTVVDTDTREAHPDHARTAVTAVVPHVHGARVRLKKVDSLLRGHVAVEVACLAAALGERVPVLCAPAFPATGRVTRGGVQHVDGVPVAASTAWAAEGRRAPDSVAAALSPLTVRTVGLADVRAGDRHLTGVLREASTRARAVVCDAETDDDLDRVVSAGSALDAPLWVGTGGLAAALARAGAAGARTGAGAAGALDPAPDPALEPGLRGPVLTVVGSASEAAAAQAVALVSAGARAVTLPSDVLTEPGPAAHDRRLELTRELADALRHGDAVVSVAGATAPHRAGPVRRGLTGLVAPAAAQAAGLVLTGGATARAVLEALGTQALLLLGEIEPGVVVSRPDDGASRRVVTKAGAFGDAGTLVRTVSSLRAGHRGRGVT